MPKVPKIQSLHVFATPPEIQGCWGFLPPDKFENFLQGGSIILMFLTRFAQSTQNNKFAMSLKMIQIRMKVTYQLILLFIFCMQINIKISYKLISTF